MKVTFDNPNIRRFFQGISDEAPVEEIKYIVDKKIGFSFLDEISSKIELAAKKASQKKIRTYSSATLSQSYSSFLINLLNGLREKDDNKVSKALKSLRDIYVTASSINDI